MQQESVWLSRFAALVVSIPRSTGRTISLFPVP
jgi:hypothetical protein